MTTPTTMPGAAHAESLLTDILLRIYVAGAVLFFAASALFHWRADPARITLLLIAASETVTAGIIVCSRRATRRDWRPLSMLTSCIAMFYFLGLDLAPGRHVVTEAAGVGLQIVGILFQLYAKLSLGRSFGILPATRRLVTGGAYRWLRHPIYFGYLIAHVGFLLANFSFQNVVVLVVLYLAQMLRIHREEAMLAQFAGYREYRKAVRYRLIPGLY
ncbi:MAG: methyltransferase family protein [Bacteroidota bacterium]